MYKVSVYGSRLGLPLSFFVHTYITTEHDGIINRYEVLSKLTNSEAEFYCGRIYKNLLLPMQGFLVVFKINAEKRKGKRWNVKHYGSLTGDQNSVAKKLYDFIESENLCSYPYRDTYNMILGPNSNTFTQWVIEQVLGCNIKLPCNAWGKNYKR